MLSLYAIDDASARRCKDMETTSSKDYYLMNLRPKAYLTCCITRCIWGQANVIMCQWRLDRIPVRLQTLSILQLLLTILGESFSDLICSLRLNQKIGTRQSKRTMLAGYIGKSKL